VAAIPSSAAAIPSSGVASDPPAKLKNPMSQLIKDTLNISDGLTDHGKIDLRMAYAKYLAIQDVDKRLAKMRTDKTWTQKSTFTDIIQVFMSKSVYHRSPAKIFPLAPSYPLMEKWLLNTEDAPTNDEVWKGKKQTYDNLSAILSLYTQKKGKAKDGNSADKKGKKKLQDDSFPDSSEEIAKKKRKEKEKEKEKSKKRGDSSKKGSSSKSGY
jgi:hypothetical protein